MIGAGGAGGAVAHALLDAGVGTLAVADMSPEQAAALVATLTDHYGPGRAEVAGDLSAACTAADGLVNCTPMGMDKHPGMPVAASDLRPDLWVADIVYFPLETELLRSARALGCRVLPGSGMALFQAVRAFRLFTGLEPDNDRMWEAFRSFDTGQAIGTRRAIVREEDMTHIRWKARPVRAGQGRPPRPPDLPHSDGFAGPARGRPGGNQRPLRPLHMVPGATKRSAAGAFGNPHPR